MKIVIEIDTLEEFNPVSVALGLDWLNCHHNHTDAMKSPKFRSLMDILQTLEKKMRPNKMKEITLEKLRKEMSIYYQCGNSLEDLGDLADNDNKAFPPFYTISKKKFDELMKMEEK